MPEDDDGTSEDTGRQQWSHPVEFLMSCVSLSVGLGNIWRFPMTAYENGGGAFLIPYLVVLTFIGRVSETNAGKTLPFPHFVNKMRCYKTGFIY